MFMKFLLLYVVVVVLFNCQLLTISYLCQIYKLNFSVSFHVSQKHGHSIGGYFLGVLDHIPVWEALCLNTFGGYSPYSSQKPGVLQTHIYFSYNVSVYACGWVCSHRNIWPYISLLFPVHTLCPVCSLQVWLCHLQLVSLSVQPRNMILSLVSETDEEADREMGDPGSLIYISTWGREHSNTDKQ